MAIIRWPQPDEQFTSAPQTALDDGDFWSGSLVRSVAIALASIAVPIQSARADEDFTPQAVVSVVAEEDAYRPPVRPSPWFATVFDDDSDFVVPVAVPVALDEDFWSAPAPWVAQVLQPIQIQDEVLPASFVDEDSWIPFQAVATKWHQIVLTDEDLPALFGALEEDSYQFVLPRSVPTTQRAFVADEEIVGIGSITVGASPGIASFSVSPGSALGAALLGASPSVGHFSFPLGAIAVGSGGSSGAPGYYSRYREKREVTVLASYVQMSIIGSSVGISGESKVRASTGFTALSADINFVNGECDINALGKVINAEIPLSWVSGDSRVFSKTLEIDLGSGIVEVTGEGQVLSAYSDSLCHPGVANVHCEVGLSEEEILAVVAVLLAV